MEEKLLTNFWSRSLFISHYNTISMIPNAEDWQTHNFLLFEFHYHLNWDESVHMHIFCVLHWTADLCEQ